MNALTSAMKPLRGGPFGEPFATLPLQSFCRLENDSSEKLQRTPAVVTETKQ